MAPLSTSQAKRRKTNIVSLVGKFTKKVDPHNAPRNYQRHNERPLEPAGADLNDLLYIHKKNLQLIQIRMKSQLGLEQWSLISKGAKESLSGGVVFGGAFDPPHNGHLYMLKQLIALNRYRLVFVMPSGLGRSDKSYKVSLEDRWQLVQLLCRNVDFRVSGDETFSGNSYLSFEDHAQRSRSDLLRGQPAWKQSAIKGPSHTEIKPCSIELFPFQSGLKGSLDTDRLIKKMYYEEQIVWLIGSDVLSGLNTWHQPEGVRSEMRFLVVPRRDGRPLSQLAEEVEKLNSRGYKIDLLEEICPPPISSSEIRRLMIQNPAMAHEFVPPNCLDYILNRGLYHQR